MTSFEKRVLEVVDRETSDLRRLFLASEHEDGVDLSSMQECCEEVKKSLERILQELQDIQEDIRNMPKDKKSDDDDDDTTSSDSSNNDGWDDFQQWMHDWNRAHGDLNGDGEIGTVEEWILKFSDWLIDHYRWVDILKFLLTDPSNLPEVVGNNIPSSITPYLTGLTAAGPAGRAARDFVTMVVEIYSATAIKEAKDELDGNLNETQRVAALSAGNRDILRQMLECCGEVNRKLDNLTPGGGESGANCCLNVLNLLGGIRADIADISGRLL